MSSPDERPSGSLSSKAKKEAKRQQAKRACDRCRQQKARCSALAGPGSRCSNCELADAECTFLYVKKQRIPRNSQAYVNHLENRIKTIEGFLQKALPDVDIHEGLLLPESRTNAEGMAAVAQPAYPQLSTCASLTQDRHSVATTPEEPEPSDDDYEYRLPALDAKLQHLSIQHYYTAWLGKSSEANLVKRAVEARSEYSAKQKGGLGLSFRLRADFWRPSPWEHIGPEVRLKKYDFPAPDLLSELVALYFKHTNLIAPLFHRPTFYQSVADGLHHQSDGFARILLLVCAVGAKFSDDPRVLLEGMSDWHSAGHKWYSQVEVSPIWGQGSATLYDLQMHAVAVVYLWGSPTQAGWITAGVGLRLAVDVGAHRKRFYKPQPTVQDELWKRAFWVLLLMDVMMSFVFGRPCAIQEEEYDVDPPIECDDEYWCPSDPAQAFKQPPEKPCAVTFFIMMMKLAQVQSCAIRTIYATGKSKAMLGFQGPEWEQRVVSKLDAELNKWLNSIPEYLRWEIAPEGDYSVQSAVLYCEFYILKVLIHRPFFSSPVPPTPLSLSSLAVCTNAAKSCIRVITVAREKQSGAATPPFAQHAAFLSAIALWVSICAMKRYGASIDAAEEMKVIYPCVEILTEAEGRWHLTGRLRDILVDIVSDVLPKSSTSLGKEREAIDSDALSKQAPLFLGSGARVPYFQATTMHPTPDPPQQNGTRMWTGVTVPSTFKLSPPATQSVDGDRQPVSAVFQSTDLLPEQMFNVSGLCPAPSLPTAGTAWDCLQPSQHSLPMHDFASLETELTNALTTCSLPVPDSLGYASSDAYPLHAPAASSNMDIPRAAPPPGEYMYPLLDPSTLGSWPGFGIQGTVPVEGEMSSMWDPMPSSFGLDEWDMYLQNHHQGQEGSGAQEP